ncbi:antitoxin YezG family protein [Rossellomorea marisflavi]|uniref:antitoxin YezG family protein n=1 Tax=Rossellomorea marisflavi TaxID=189381 RepID=UPI00064EF6DF|nr:antitoxin YezG family protein [Rossellomorea marisflavi]KMK95090.1 cytoplasmic protein [Rossellomorea marisflavi]
MEKEMNKLYREIAETVNEMIPEEWEKFYFYAQISETGGGTYFFYNTPENSQHFHYSVEIPFNYSIDKEEFKKNKRKLFELSDELRNVFKDNQQEIWYSFTMTLESSGKFKMHYDYTNWFNTDYLFSDQMMIWKNKYLGEVPSDGEYKALIDQYHSEFPDDPI